MSKRKRAPKNKVVEEVEEDELEEVIGFKYASKIPTPDDCIAAVGKFDSSPIPAAYIPNGNFAPLRVPTHEDDWLAQHPPDNQTFQKWHTKYLSYKRDVQKSNKIYLLPIGKMDHIKNLPPLQLLADFCKAFFMNMDIQVLDPMPIEKKSDNTHFVTVKREGKRPRVYSLESRHSHPYDTHKMDKSHRQYSVHPLLDICGAAAPSDARFTVGVTMEDLYSDTTDSFTVGMATGPLCGVALFSFARYDPLFESRCGKKTAKKKQKTLDATGEHKTVLLERSCKVLAHEIGHMCGIAHCTYYECLMNGSGHLVEDFRQPHHLCPVDLRKLIVTLEVDPVERYKELLAFYTKAGFTEQSEWVKNRMKFIETYSPSDVIEL